MDYSEILQMQGNGKGSAPIAQICKDLGALTILLKKFVSSGTLSLGEDKQLLDFFIKYKNTNELVFHAIRSIKETPAVLLEEFSSLLDSAEQFLSYNDCHKDQIGSLDFQADCKSYIKPFEDMHNRSVAEAGACWRSVQEISNKLDFLDERADGYEDLMRELDDKEALYNAAHSRVDETYAILQERQKDIYALFGFSFDMLLIVIDKMKQIAISVIDDVNKLMKGDCP